MCKTNVMRRAGSALLLAAMLVCPGISTAAGDLSGTWVGIGRVADRDSMWPKEPPYTPEGLAAQQKAGTADDPAFNCVIGFGRIMAAGFPTEIIQHDDQIWMLYEYNHQFRRICMDGRGHPKKVRPTLMGHSVGRWEGSTLVVETIGIKPLYFRNNGIPYSEAARVTERMTRIDEGKTLEVLIHVDDPKYYTESWDAKKYMAFGPDTQFLEYDCTYREHLSAPTK